MRGQFHFIEQLNGHPNLRTYHFESSEDIMTKLKSQALHVIRIKYILRIEKLVGVALLNIGILLHKQSTHAKHFGLECIADLRFRK